jgi:hypothetical protein
MRARSIVFVVPLLLLVLATGCVYSRGFIGFAKGEPAEASAGSYPVVKPKVKGEASCTYLFGVFPLGNPAVATQAMDRLRESAQVPGRSIGLLNFTGDEVIANYFGVVTRRSLSIQADAVEVGR